MIHFLISHSISLYCQTEREGMEGTETWERGDTDEEESKQRKGAGEWGWVAENEIKQKKRGFWASQATHHLAMKSSAVTSRLCKTTGLIWSAGSRTLMLALLSPHSFHTFTKQRPLFDWHPSWFIIMCIMSLSSYCAANIVGAPPDFLIDWNTLSIVLILLAPRTEYFPTSQRVYYRW